MKKSELRDYFIKERFNLSYQEINIKTAEILKILVEKFDLKEKKICCYLPIKSKKEINTFQLLELSKELNFEFISTKWDTIDNRLSVYKITDKHDLQINSFDIPEPKSTIKQIHIKEIDIIVVPLLAFDLNGNRVGYGKGVYDRFLKEFNKKKTPFIGLSIFDPIEEISDVYPTDIKLTHCITPKKLYIFEKQS